MENTRAQVITPSNRPNLKRSLPRLVFVGAVAIGLVAFQGTSPAPTSGSEQTTLVNATDVPSSTNGEAEGTTSLLLTPEETPSGPLTLEQGVPDRAGETLELLDPEELAKQLEFPVVSIEMLDEADAIEAQWGADPRYSAIEIANDRTELVVWWHGGSEVPATLANSDSEYRIRLEPTPELPGDLRQAAKELINSPYIAAVEVPKEGTSVVVSLAKSARNMTTEPSELISSLSSKYGVPVSLGSEAPPIAATRQNDSLTAGGARIYRFESGRLTAACSTGFTVRHTSGQLGMMTAAHCGPRGSQWVRWPDNTGTTVAPYGNDGVVRSVTLAYDGAVIAVRSALSIVYWGAWNHPTNSAYAISGLRLPRVGLEVCYSGASSGTTCGNMVTATAQRYTLQELPGIEISGHLTRRNGGAPAAGEGDSGGPGIALATEGGTVKAYAVSIISALPGSTGSTNCVGIQGRLCGPAIYATSISNISAASGWHIP